MKILVAPDKFKGCLSAAEAASLIAEGVRQAGANHEVTLMPIADGGEGTADAMRAAMHGVWMEAASHDALGRPMTGRYAWMPSASLAVIEMSLVAGLAALAEPERAPLRATTYGVGELMLDAMRRGARRIVVGLGGSATNDAGVGMAAALGWRFSPVTDEQAWVAPEGFTDVKTLTSPAPSARPAWPEIIAACDVTNPLLGPRGATRVYGPQKGASETEVEKLEAALRHIADLAAAQLGFDPRDLPGAGAAGGLGYGLMTFAGARLTPGFALIAELIGIRSALADCDLVLTGEGCLDGQTLAGKGPAGVAELARRLGKPVIALAGRVRLTPADETIFDRCIALAEEHVPTETALREASSRLRAAAREAVTNFQNEESHPRGPVIEAP